jgi:hypothetical protein
MKKAVKDIKLNMKNFRDQDTVLVNSYHQAADKEYPEETFEGLPIHTTPGLHGFLETLIGRHIPEGGHVLDVGAGSERCYVGAFDKFEISSTSYRYCKGELQAS